jgi:hypothetical protein
VVAAVCLLLSVIGVVRARMVAAAAAGLGAASVLAGPVAYSLTTVNNAAGGTLASAGPSTGGGPGGGGRFPGLTSGAGAAGNAAARLRGPAGASLPPGSKGLGTDGSANQALVSYLEKHQGSAEYLVAVTGSQTAAPIILSTGKPVIAMGGFSGGDPTPTLTQFKALVATGKVHYVIVGGATGGATRPGATLGGGFPGRFPGGAGGSFPRPPGAGSGGFPGGLPGSFPGGRGGAQAGPGGRSSTVSAIDAWVTSHGTQVSYGSNGGGTLYFVSSAAAT